MPRIVDHDQRRREIAYAVWELIAENGIAGVTLRSIAARAGVSMGRVQHYFPSRDAIVLHGLTVLLGGADTVYPAAPADLRELLLPAIARSPERRLAAKVWYAYQTEAITDSALAGPVRRALDEAETAVAAHLGGDRDAARTLLSVVDGLAYRVLVGHTTPDDAERLLGAAIDRAL